jgi:hypothetical protein
MAGGIGLKKMILARIEGGDTTCRISPSDNAAKNIFLKSDMIDSCQEKKDICRPFNREKKRTFYDYLSRALVEAGSF